MSNPHSSETKEGEMRGGHYYVNNTRAGTGKIGDSDPDRHIYRDTRNGTRKCGKCFDYNKGVSVGGGGCYKCGAPPLKQ